MMEYQRTIRERQLERAKKLLRLKDPEKIKKDRTVLRDSSRTHHLIQLIMYWIWIKSMKKKNTMDSMP